MYTKKIKEKRRNKKHEDVQWPSVQIKDNIIYMKMKMKMENTYSFFEAGKTLEA